jgi:glycosyltransferase involved in cell wall biosynthesis
VPPVPSGERVEFSRRPLTVLALSTHFPKPGNPKMGIWALRQARAIEDAGAAISVCSLTEWVPRRLGPLLRSSARLRRLDAWASCPSRGRMDGVDVFWPRWPRHSRGPHGAWCFAHPKAEVVISWPFARRSVLGIVDEVKPDVIYATGSLVSGWVAAMTERERGIPYVLQDVDVDELRAARSLPARARLYREVGAGAVAWVVCSGRMADDVRAFGCEPFVLPYGTPELPAPAREPEPRVVLCVCNLLERKRVPQLVSAFGRIAQRHPQVQLRILGDGPDLPAVHAAIAASGLNERTKLLPRETDAFAEMSEADVFALVSREEPFGVVYLEALAAGCAVLCGDDAGVLDFVSDGTHVLTAPADDEVAIAAALERLLTDSELRAGLARTGREHVLRTLTWDRHAERLIGVLERARGAAPEPVRG